MAGPFYMDPAATGSNDGSSWTNAWTSLQTAADTAVAGEIVYCRGTQTVAAAIDFDTNAGTNTGGWPKFIGCNASGNRDGTRFCVDVNNSDAHGIVVTVNMIWFENIEVKNCGGTNKHGFYRNGAGGLGSTFINVSSHNNSGYGCHFESSGTFFFRSTFYANGHGIYASGHVAFCSSHDNTGNGMYLTANAFACLSYDNGDDNWTSVSSFARYINCVSDGAGDDGIVLPGGTSTAGAILIGMRITNQSGAGDIGLNCGNENCLTIGCYFEDNDGNNIQNDSLHLNISLDGTGATSNVEDQANTNEGYVSTTDGSEDFGLRSDASSFEQSIVIPIV